MTREQALQKAILQLEAAANNAAISRLSAVDSADIKIRIARVYIELARELDKTK